MLLITSRLQAIVSFQGCGQIDGGVYFVTGTARILIGFGRVESEVTRGELQKLELTWTREVWLWMQVLGLVAATPKGQEIFTRIRKRSFCRKD